MKYMYIIYIDISSIVCETIFVLGCRLAASNSSGCLTPVRRACHNSRARCSGHSSCRAAGIAAVEQLRRRRLTRSLWPWRQDRMT